MKWLTVVLWLVVPAYGLAQAHPKRTFSLSLGPEVSFAESPLSRTHGMGIGGSVKGEYTFGEHVSATFNVASHWVFGKDVNTGAGEVSQPNLTLLAFKPGLRYYIGNFYVAGEAGAGFYLNGGSGSSFIYSAGIGDKIRISGRIIDIGVRHEKWQHDDLRPGFIMVRLAFELL